MRMHAALASTERVMMTSCWYVGSDFAADVTITQGQGCSYTYRPDDFAG